MTNKDFVVGQEVAFFYHQKQRLVEVVKVGGNYIVSKNLDPTDPAEFKTFTITKMESVVISPTIAK